jgi:hypothetical protein
MADWVGTIFIIVVWIIIQTWLLPKAGVST